MIKKYCVYKITNKLSGRAYIGKTKANPNRRWRDHVRTALSKNNKKIKQHVSYLHRAMAKYKIDNFSFEILEYFESEDEAYEKEIYYIKQFDTYYNGYNETLGGRSTKGPSRKLTRRQIYFIFKDYAENGMATRELVKKYNICKDSILAILHRINYIDVLIPDELAYQVWLKLRCHKTQIMAENYKYKDYYKDNKIKVRSIFDDFISGYTIKQLAEKYNMVIGNVYFILQRQTFKNIKVPKYIVNKANILLLKINEGHVVVRKNNLSNEDIENIFLLYSEGVSINDISEKFQCSQNKIRHVLYRDTYDYVYISNEILTKVERLLKKGKCIYEEDQILNIFEMYYNGNSIFDISKQYNSEKGKIITILNSEKYQGMNIPSYLRDFAKQKLNTKEEKNFIKYKNNIVDIAKDFLFGRSYKDLEKKYHMDPRYIKEMLSTKDLFNKDLQDKIELEISRRNALK